MTTVLSPDRRAFLKTGAAAGTGLLIGFHLPAFASSGSAEEQEKKKSKPAPAKLSLFGWGLGGKRKAG